jgi:transposase-like protein
MTLVALKCLFCGSDRVGKNGLNNGKQRYLCKNAECTHQTFFAEYTYNACKPEVKSSIAKFR